MLLQLTVCMVVCIVAFKISFFNDAGLFWMIRTCFRGKRFEGNDENIMVQHIVASGMKSCSEEELAMEPFLKS